jgi:hypothetical protein
VYGVLERFCLFWGLLQILLQPTLARGKSGQRQEKFNNRFAGAKRK